MTNIDSIFKNRHITLSTKVQLLKAIIFPTVVYGCEIWIIKKTERWTMVLENTLENPLDCKEIKLINPKGNQSWIFTGRTDVEAETPILWPPDANKELTHWKRPWCWVRLKAGEEDGRGQDGWMASLTYWTWVWASSRSWWTGNSDVPQSMGSQRVRHNWATELNWSISSLTMFKIKMYLTATRKIKIQLYSMKI